MHRARRRLLKAGIAGLVTPLAGCFDSTEVATETAATETRDRTLKIISASIRDTETVLGVGARVEVTFTRLDDATPGELRVTVNGDGRASTTPDGETGPVHTVRPSTGEHATRVLSVWFHGSGTKTISVNGTVAGTVDVADSWRQCLYDGAKTGHPTELDAPVDGIVTSRHGMPSISFGFVPVVAGERAYVNVGHPAFDIMAADTDWGGLVEYHLESGRTNFVERTDWVINAPTVVQNTVIAGTYRGEVGAQAATTSGQAIGYSLTGERRWSRELDSGVVGGLATNGRLAVVPAYSGIVTAHEPRTGAVRWEYDCEAAITSSAVVGQTTVFVGDNDGVVHALDADTGNPLWTAPVAGAVDSAPTLSGDRLLVPSHDPHDQQSPDGRLSALESSTGQELWQRETGQWMGTSPVTDGQLAYAGVGRSIWAFDPASGAVRWRGPAASEARYPTEGEPIVTDDRLYAVLGHDEGSVFALDPQDGTEVWRYNNRVTLTSLALTDGALLVGSRGEDAPRTTVNKVVALEEAPETETPDATAGT